MKIIIKLKIMEEFLNFFTRKNVERIALTLFFIGLIGVVWSIIGGIWGIKPNIEYFNLKIFGTSLLIGVIGIIIGYANDEQD